MTLHDYMLSCAASHREPRAIASLVTGQQVRGVQRGATCQGGPKSERLGGPRDHINSSISNSGFMGQQFEEDTRNHGLQDPHVYVVSYSVFSSCTAIGSSAV